MINRLVLPPYGLSALIDFAEAVEARSAFTKLAYTKFKNAPLYLEWAPDDAFKRPFVKPEDDDVEDVKELSEETPSVEEKEKEEKKVDDGEEGHEEGATLFVKNLNFVTTDADLRQHFETCGEVRNLHFLYLKCYGKLPTGVLCKCGDQERSSNQRGFVHGFRLHHLQEEGLVGKGSEDHAAQ